jgi:hypothetical protein
MAEGRQRSEWWQTSFLLAQMVNVNGGDRNKQAVDPRKLNPFEIRDDRRAAGLADNEDDYPWAGKEASNG